MVIYLTFNQRSNYQKDSFSAELSHRDLLGIAYMNCLNSFVFPSIAGGSADGQTINLPIFPHTRFVYNMMIFDGLIDADKDKLFFENEHGQDFADQDVASMLETMHPNEAGMFTAEHWARYCHYWYRLDQLMRRQSFYATTKIPSAHL